jgi:hypothetical protein
MIMRMRLNSTSPWLRGGLIGACFLAAVLAIPAQTIVMPQIADGGGWQTTIVVSNTTSSTASASLSFYQDTTGGATQSWSLPLIESISTQNLSLAGGGTIFLHTPGTAATTSQGWGSLQASSGVVGYAIYTYRAAGHQDQDATAPGVASASRILVPYDNTNGLVTAIAVVNPTATSETVSVSFQSETGGIVTGSLPTLPPNGHSAFVLPTQFPGTPRRIRYRHRQPLDYRAARQCHSGVYFGTRLQSDRAGHHRRAPRRHRGLQQPDGFG